MTPENQPKHKRPLKRSLDHILERLREGMENLVDGLQTVRPQPVPIPVPVRKTRRR